MSVYRYSAAPSIQSMIFEKFLWAARIKSISLPPEKEFKKRDYSRALISPSPPEYLKLRVDIQGEAFDTMNLFVMEPKDTVPRLTILYLHGGSYLYNATRPHWRFLTKLVESANCRVIEADYPLAPEHSYADAYKLLVPYYKKLCAQVGSESLLLMGDSAGGGLSLGLAMAARDEGLPACASMLLLSPWLDVTMTNPFIEAIDPDDPFLNVQALKTAGQAWAKGANPRKPWISPLYGKVDGLPPMHLFIGTKDILLADARRFQEICRAQKANLSFYEYENMVHVWMLLEFKEGKLAAERIAAIVNSVQSRAE